jgi:hypothetical protein
MVVQTLAHVKNCSAECESFKCVKNSNVHSGGGIWCKWTEEMCSIANCSYALCTKRRLLPKGICGETIKRRTVEKMPDDVVGPTIKLHGKTLRKFGEKEIF